MNSSRRWERGEDELSDISVSNSAGGGSAQRGRGRGGRGRPPGRQGEVRGRVQGSVYRVEDDVFQEDQMPPVVGSAPTVGNVSVEMESTPARGGAAVGSGQDRDGNKRTVDDRSPPQEAAARNVRPRLNEFDLGDLFSKIEERMLRSTEELLSVTPDELKGNVKAGLEVMVKTMHDVMCGLSDGIQQERLNLEAMESRVEDRLEKVEEKLAEVSNTADSLTRNRRRGRVRDSIKEMERKVEDAQSSLKLMNIDIGRQTEDRREIVRSTIDEVRRYVREDDLRYFDRVIKKTRIVILGKGTSRCTFGEETTFSVPTLFQCRDRRDVDELESILRAAGYFPTFHWPREIMDFIGGVKDEVRKQGLRNEDHFFKVRPEVREGKTRIKVEVKLRTGVSRFLLKGVWDCPPLDRDLWDSVPELYTNRLGRRD